MSEIYFWIVVATTALFFLYVSYRTTCKITISQEIRDEYLMTTVSYGLLSIYQNKIPIYSVSKKSKIDEYNKAVQWNKKRKELERL